MFNLTDPLGLTRMQGRLLQGTPLADTAEAMNHNKAFGFLMQGPQALMPAQYQPPSPWAGMQMDDMEDQQKKLAGIRDAYSAMANNS